MKTKHSHFEPAGPRITSTRAGLPIRFSSYRAAVLALFLAGATLLSIIAASADTITVININDSGPGSLRQALVDAHDGDTINFDSSLKGQTITLTSGQLNVDKDVTISGLGANNLAVDGNANDRVFYINPGKTVTISGLTITNGHSVTYGGGIYNDHATLTVTNCTLIGNSGGVTYGGGGIDNGGTLTISNSTISGNSADSAGGIANGGTLTITNSTLSGNSAGNRGGGIANGGTLTISNSTISGNSAGNSGGGIANGGTLTITNSTISGNSAGFGGGIANGAQRQLGGGDLTVSNSTISGNSAVNGGGIGSQASALTFSEVTVSNSTITGNSATANGGGIFNFNLGGETALELGSTILNEGSSGENIFNFGGTVTSHGYNLSSDDGGGYLTGPGDQINTDPLLGPLQDNGGPTFTHALLLGSPAIGTGDPNFIPPPFYDQRGPGFDRVVNGRIDVGSFEVQAAPTPTPTPTVTPTPTATATPTPTSSPWPRPTPIARPRPTPPPRP